VVKLANIIYLFIFLFLQLRICDAQENFLQKRITVQFKNTDLEQALKTVSQKGTFLFSYNAGHIDHNKIIDESFHNEKIVIILNKILGKGYTYTVAGKHVIIRASKIKTETKTPKQETKSTLNGYITDDKGRKLSSVTIYEIGELNAVTSDNNGYFSLEINPNAEWLSLYINKKLYHDTIIEVVPRKDKNVNVRLRSEIIFQDTLKPLTAVIRKDTIENTVPSLLIPNKQVEQTLSLPLYEIRKAQISFVPAIGTNHIYSGLVANKFSFNILGGYAMAVDGFEMAGMFNIIREDVKGFQMAGFANLTGRNVNGFQMAGFSNSIRGSLKGMQMAGFTNISLDSIVGVQMSGFTNVSGKSSQGAQISGFANISGNEARGLQLAGFTNITNGDIKGLQIAGFMNYNRLQSSNVQIAGFMNLANEVSGVQIAGFSNFTYKTMKGSQISGFMNYAKKINGIQIGVFNFCDTICGIPIGFLSFVRKGYHSLEYNMNEQQAFSLAFKTGTHRFYNILKAGKFAWNNNDDISLGYGIGTQQKIKGKFALELDITGSILYNTINRKVPEVLWANASLNLVYQPFKFLTFFAGPTVNSIFSETEYDLPLQPNRGLNEIPSGSLGIYNFSAWIGYNFGVRIF